MSAKKFEKMIECIVNDDEAKAKALFHDIIVEKSRQIYESMMAEDESMGFMDEIESEEEGMDGMMEGDDEFETDEEISGDYDVEGDEGEFDMEDEEDEFNMDDEGMGDEDGEFGGDDELEDRVVDLEDKLDQLMADFEAQMGDEDFGDDEGGDEEEFGAEEEFDDEGGDEEFGADEEEDGLMENVSLTKVRGLYDSNIGGDDGVQTKSTVAANSGKRGMQGKPVNYDAGAEESQANGPKKPGSYVTKGQKEVEGSKSFKNLPGKNNFTAKGESTPKPVKTQQSGTNTRSAVPESKRTTKKRI